MNVCCNILQENMHELVIILMRVSSLEFKKMDAPKLRLTVQLFIKLSFH